MTIVKVGDTLVAHLTVAAIHGAFVELTMPPCSGNRGGVVQLLKDGGDVERLLFIHRFVEHIPAPLKIEVGVRVRRDDDRSSDPTYVYEVRYVLSGGKSIVLRGFDGDEWLDRAEGYVVVQEADS